MIQQSCSPQVYYTDFMRKILSKMPVGLVMANSLMKTTLLFIIFSMLSACAREPIAQDSITQFIVNKKSSSLVNLNHKNMKNKSGFAPARQGNMLAIKYFNSHSEPITISRIEFPIRNDAICSMKSNDIIHIPPYSVSDIELVDISTLLTCHPELDVNKGYKFIGIPGDYEYAASTLTTWLTLQFDIEVHSLKSSVSGRYPLVFDISTLPN